MKVLSIDIGTTSICASVLDGKTGIVLESQNIDNGSFIESPYDFEKIQDPAVILLEAEGLIDSLIKKYTPIAGIGMTGQMHGIVYLDVKGNAVSPLYTWQDGRGNLIYEGDKTYASYLSQLTGYKLSTGYGTVTHFYNIRNKLVPSNAVKFCTIQDYVAMKLTEGSEPLTHVSDAASLGLFKLQEAEFDREALKRCDMDISFFPAVTDGYEILGKTNGGIPVVVAIGDNQASFIGSVNNMKNSILVNLGTGGQISIMSENFVQEKTMETRPCASGTYLLVGASLCGGRAYALLESFFRSVIEMAGFPSKNLYPYMDALSEDFETLENKLTISTLFSGTREDPTQLGSIENLGTGNFTPKHFITGVLEGTVNELYQMYNRLEVVPNAKFTTLVGSGNGIRKSAVMQRMLSKKFGMEVKIPAHKEEAAYGAALFAMVGIGFYDSIQSAQKIIQYPKSKE